VDNIATGKEPCPVDTRYQTNTDPVSTGIKGRKECNRLAKKRTAKRKEGLSAITYIPLRNCSI